jgi:hypothetical protein
LVTNTPTNTPANTPIPFQGCTPGYWKQTQHLDSWLATGISPNQTLESVFDVPKQIELDNKTLRQALSFKVGTTDTAAARILLRATVSALLKVQKWRVNILNASPPLKEEGQGGENLRLRDLLGCVGYG